MNLSHECLSLLVDDVNKNEECEKETYFPGLKSLLVLTSNFVSPWKMPWIHRVIEAHF